MDRKSYQLKYGTILDERYRIENVLGEGGFGITYAGRNERIGIKVAIKEFFCREYMDRTVSESDEVFLTDAQSSDRFEKEKARFLKEARVLGDFAAESGVVHVNDYFESNGTAYIVMTFLEGITLREHVKQNGPMDSEILLRKMKPILNTLGKVHSSGLLHRDISPDNIMLLDDGSLCLIDFGAAYSYDAAEKSFSVICKRSYSAPEMYRSTGEMDPRADIYSISSTLYYCLTGCECEDSLQRILLDEMPSPKKLNQDIPEDVNNLICKGLELKAERRWGSTDELLKVIEDIYPEKQPEAAGRISKKTIAIIIACAAAAAAIMIGLLIYLPHRTELRFRNLDTTVIRLIVPDDMTLKDFNSSKESVRDRLEIMTGKDNYLWREDEEGISLEVPVDTLSGEDPNRIARSFLASPSKLYISDNNDHMLSALKEITIPVSESAISDVSIESGEIEGVDREVNELPESGDYSYYKITLDEQTAAAVNSSFDNILERKGEPLKAYLDILQDSDTYYYKNCISAGDGRTFYLIEKYQEDSFLQMRLYSLTHEQPDAVFSVLAGPVVNWEDPSTSIIAGDYQVDAGDISGESMLLIYRFSWADSEIKSSWVHNIVAFKQRMEALKIPYAFGLLDYDGSAFVIKTDSGNVYKEAFSTLAGYGAYELELKTKWHEVTSAEVEKLQYDEAAEAITITPKTNLNISETGIGSGNDKAYLLYSGFPIAQIDTARLLKNGDFSDITFTDLLFDFDKDFLDYVKASDTERTDNSGSLEKVFMYDGDECVGEMEPDDLREITGSIYTVSKLEDKITSFASNEGGYATFDHDRVDGLKVYLWFYDKKPDELCDDLLAVADKFYDEFSQEISSGNIAGTYIWLDMNDRNSDKWERLGIAVVKSYTFGRMSLNAVYNQNTGLDNQKTGETIIEYFNNSRVLRDVFTADCDVLDMGSYE